MQMCYGEALRRIDSEGTFFRGIFVDFVARCCRIKPEIVEADVIAGRELVAGGMTWSEAGERLELPAPRMDAA
jgi:hypothetical protein